MADDKRVLFNILESRTIYILESLEGSNSNLITEVSGILFKRGSSISNEELGRIRTAKDLWNFLETKKVISMDNVQMLKYVAKYLKSKELEEEIKSYENDCSGMVQKAGHLETCLGVLKGCCSFSVIMLKTFLKTAAQTAAVTGTVAFFMNLFHDNPEALKTSLSHILPYSMDLVGLKKGSLYFMLGTSSLSSLQQLWTSYKDGSLEKKFKKVINEIDEVRQLTQGTEIDVTVEIDEDEYREACWVLVLAKIDQDEEEARNIQRLRQRRHSLSCTRAFSRDKTHLSWQELRTFNKVENKLDYETKRRICEKQPSAEPRVQEMEIPNGTNVNANSEKEDITVIDDETRKLMSAWDQKRIKKLKKVTESREDTLVSALETDDKNEVGTAYFGAGMSCYILGILYEETNEKENCEDTMKKAENYFRKAADSWEKLKVQLNNKDEKSNINHSLFFTYHHLTSVLLATKQTEEALVVSDNMRDRGLVDTMIEKFQMTNRNRKEILSESMKHANISSILKNENVSVFIYAVRGSKINIWTLEYQKPSIFLEKIVPAAGTESYHEAFTFFQWTYEPLIASVLPNLTQDKLVIIADGTHQLLPFAALRDPKTGQYLSETKCIRYAPSLSAMKVWKECPVEYHAKTGALVVGDPDVGTVLFKGEECNFPRSRFAQREAMVVGAILNASPLVGPRATKDEVLKRLQEPLAIIHIAAMGNQKGEIFLAPSAATGEVRPQESDYLLTVEEVQEMRIRTSLVVLSFDGSGCGEIMSGKVNSMARAFLAAGARAVVASLWDSDEVAKRSLMITFYTYLKMGKNASKSLQNAMKELRDDGYEEPEYWAPFFLIGDDVTISG